MSTILRVIGGVALVAMGVSLVIKSDWFLSNFGRIDWAEQHLGLEGGTRLFYKLLGCATCLIGIMVALNLFRGFFLGTVGRFLFNSEQYEQIQQQEQQ